MQQLLMRHHDEVAEFVGKKVPAELRGVLAAEDICQEAYVVAVRSLPLFEYRGERSFVNWLLTLAERKLIDMVRAQQAAKRGGGRRAVDVVGGDASSIVTLLEQVAVHERTPSQSAVAHEAAARVRQALESLDDGQRTALRCCYLEGLSVGETAARMGRTEGAVRKLCERGLQRLAEHIGDPARFFSRNA